jgi:hypothetical protein
METALTPRNPADSSRTSSLIRLNLVVLLIGVGVVVPVRPAGPRFGFSNLVHGSGVAATQTRNVAPFTDIDLAGVSTVSVHVGVKQTVVVHADTNLIARVTTDIRNGTLVIAERGNFSTDHPVSVEVTVPRLEGIALSGSGHVNVEGARARTFSVRESGSGALTVTGAVGSIACDDDCSTPP